MQTIATCLPTKKVRLGWFIASMGAPWAGWEHGLIEHLVGMHLSSNPSNAKNKNIVHFTRQSCSSVSLHSLLPSSVALASIPGSVC
jgi:hypothetical protein